MSYPTLTATNQIGIQPTSIDPIGCKNRIAGTECIDSDDNHNYINNITTSQKALYQAGLDRDMPCVQGEIL